jgi:hypothetical protein
MVYGYVAMRVLVIIMTDYGLLYVQYIRTMLTKDTHIIAIKNYIDMTTIFFNRRQKVSKVGKKLIFLTS